MAKSFLTLGTKGVVFHYRAASRRYAYTFKEAPFILEILIYFSANLSILLDEDTLNATRTEKDLNMTDITELLRPGIKYI